MTNHATRPDPVELDRLLSDHLGRLRESRPGFQDQLETRLVAQLTAPAQSWWRRALGGDAASHPTPLRRWPVLGAAAAAALLLSAVGMSLLSMQPGEVSASEILERAQLAAESAQAARENPFATNVKSFHLKATTSGTLPFGGPTPEGVTEQWFKGPDRSRTETRTRAADGNAVVSGNVVDGKSQKIYATPGHEAQTVSVTPMGIAIWLRSDGPPPPDKEKRFVVEGQVGEAVEGKVEKAVEGQVEEREVDQVFAVCLEPERKGEVTIAGRKAYAIEHKPCDGSDVPDELRGRHAMWVDKETYIPLKVEDYGADGKLRFKYEVSTIEYDVDIPDSVFTAIPPAGTILKHEGPRPEIMIEEKHERRSAPGEGAVPGKRVR